LSGVVVSAVVAAAIAAGGELAWVAPGATLLFSFAESAAIGYRDELWLHGLPLLFAARAGLPRGAAIAFAAAASVAAIALEPGASVASLALTASSAVWFALLWQRTGDAWAPVAAHLAWAWVSEALLAGELLDLASAQGRIARGLGASGAPAWIATAAFAALAIATALGRLPLGARAPEAKATKRATTGDT
jgi:hypothetical protein